MTAPPDAPRGARSGEPGITCPTCQSSDVDPIPCGTAALTASTDRTRIGGPVDAARPGDGQVAWRCRACAATSTDQPRPSLFTLFDSAATPEDIAAQIARTLGDRAPTPGGPQPQSAPPGLVTIEAIDGRVTLTIAETATLLGLGRTAAYEAARRGQIPTRRLGRRLVVPVPALLAWLGVTADPSTDGC